MAIDLSKEFTQYKYYNENDDWKQKLPSFKLTASPQQAKAPLVSIIIANFNNKRYLKRMMDSLVNQSIGLDQLQILFIDDKSTDQSLDIVLPYVEKYPSIEVYQLDENTGGAHGPRNVGILNARGKYFAFLDADDWYAERGIEHLVHLLEESGDKIGFGGIIRSINNKHHKAVVAYLEANFQHRSINELPFEFYAWLGPQGILVDGELVRQNNLHFIDQRVADDVTFFYQVMRIAGQVSQTTELTTYLNRDDSNESLSKGKTEVFMVSWLRALAFLKQQYPLDHSQVLFLSKRLEWLVNDFALKFDTGYGFSEGKVRHFDELLRAYLGELDFDPANHMREPDCKIAWRYLQDKDYEGLAGFVAWNSLERKDKRWQVVDGLHYAVADDAELPKVYEKCYATADGMVSEAKSIVVKATVYSKEAVDGFELRSVKDPWSFVYLPYQEGADGSYFITLSREVYSLLTTGDHRLLVRTNQIYDYPLVVMGIANSLKNDSIFHEENGILLVKKYQLSIGRFLINGTDGYEIVEADRTAFDITGTPVLMTAEEKLIHSPISVANGITEQVVNELADIFYLVDGNYKMIETAPIYRISSDGEYQEIQSKLTSGEVIQVRSISIADDTKVYFEFLPGQFVWAEKRLLTKAEKTAEALHADVHFSGKNFIITVDRVPVFETAEAIGKTKVRAELRRGDLIKASDFCVTMCGEYAIALDSGGFISGAKDLTMALADSVAVGTYQTTIGKYVIIGREELGYVTPTFSREKIARRYKRGTKVTVVGFGIGNNGIPRLKLSDGNYLTAHRKFVQFKGYGSW